MNHASNKTESDFLNVSSSKNKSANHLEEMRVISFLLEHKLLPETEIKRAKYLAQNLAYTIQHRRQKQSNITSNTLPDPNLMTGDICILLLLLLTRESQGNTISSTQDLVALCPDSQSIIERIEEHLKLHTYIAQDANPNSQGVYPLVVRSEESNDAWWGFSGVWAAESRMIEILQSFLQEEPEFPEDFDAQQNFISALRYAAPQEFQAHVRQWMSLCSALVNRFTIISGGPGTGKTTMVRMLLLAIKEYHNLEQSRMILTAPTGRAKARLQEGVQSSIEVEARTLYSLLGLSGSGTPRWNQNNPLPYDLIVVDESSMMDVWTFTALLEALSPECRLILIGDMDQLPSVEAGAVLGDLTSSLQEKENEFSWNQRMRQAFGWLTLFSEPDDSSGNDVITLFARDLQHEITLPAHQGSEVSPFVQHVTFLTKNQRSDQKVIDWWNYRTTTWTPPVTKLKTHKDWLKHFSPWLQSWKNDMHTVLKDWENSFSVHLDTSKSKDKDFVINTDDFRKLIISRRILCATNHGTFGRHTLNKMIEQSMSKISQNALFQGTPIIIERNMRIAGYSLYNGDLGLALSIQNQRRGYFICEGKVVSFPLQSIAHYSTAWAITIHKSQGSEFDSVLIALPNEQSALISRQLLYTGITRVKSELLINDPADMLNRELPSIQRKTRFGLTYAVSRAL